MSGFKNKELNDIAKFNIFEDIIEFLFSSMDQMKQDLLLQNKKIKNNEEKIRTHLLENYLDEPTFRKKEKFNEYLLFEPEVPVGYDKEKDIYIGRVDIKVFNVNTIISNKEDYYIIECKRIDGHEDLNKKYVIEGICRFVLDPPKYSSFNKKNAMLGFVVKNIDINENVNKINDIQEQNEDIHIIKKIQKCNITKGEYYLYKNEYQCGEKQIELNHMFYDLSEIIK